MRAIACIAFAAALSVVGGVSVAQAKPFTSGYCAPSGEPSTLRATIVRYWISLANKRDLPGMTSFLTKEVAAIDMEERSIAIGTDALADYDPSGATKIEILELFEAGDRVVIKAREEDAPADEVSFITFGFSGGCIDSIAF